MGQPYVGEIRMFGGNYAPAGWMFCNGQLLPISEYETLFNLIGTTYGGDGQNNFQLPDLQCRVPLHFGQLGGGGTTYNLAEEGGVETVTLSLNQIPTHSHPAQCNGNATQGTSNNPSNKYWGNGNQPTYYNQGAPPPSTVQLAAGAITPQGGSQPHDNMVPFLCVSFIISLFGIYPSPT